MNMMNQNRYSVYQLKDDPDCRKLRGRTYGDLCRDGLSVDPANYRQIYMSGMEAEDTARKILRRLVKTRPDHFPGNPIDASDVIALIVDEWPTAWYVNDLRGGMTLLPGFFKPSGNGNMRLVFPDGGEYEIEGEEGSWIPCRETIISGIPFYEMQCRDDARALHIFVSFDGRLVSDHFHEASEREWGRAAELLKKYRKHYENGEYIRLLGDHGKVDIRDVGKIELSLDEQIRKARQESEERKREEEERRQREAEELNSSTRESVNQMNAAQKGKPPEHRPSGPWPGDAQAVYSQIHSNTGPEGSGTAFSEDVIADYLRKITMRLDAIERQLKPEQQHI